MGDALGNFAGGINGSLYGALGGPVDLTSMFMNAITQPGYAGTNNIPIFGPILGATQYASSAMGIPAFGGPDTVGSSAWLEQQGQKVGIVPPSTIPVSDAGDAMARMAGGGVGLAATLPFGAGLGWAKTMPKLGPNSVAEFAPANDLELALGTGSAIPKRAEALKYELGDLGLDVSRIDHSVNRHGENSSYVTVRGAGIAPLKVRVSDHSKNPNFDESYNVGDLSSAGEVERYAERIAKDVREAEAKWTADAPARAAAKKARDDAAKAEADGRAAQLAREQAAAEAKRSFMATLPKGLTQTAMEKAWKAHKAAQKGGA